MEIECSILGPGRSKSKKDVRVVVGCATELTVTW